MNNNRKLRGNDLKRAKQGWPNNLMLELTGSEDSLPSKEDLERVLSTLTVREKEVIELRYGLFDGYIYTLEEVGRKFKVTRERIRQIEAKALRKLRYPGRLNFITYRTISIQEYNDLKNQILALEMLNNFEKTKLTAVPIETLDLSVRAYNALKRSGLNSIPDILNIGEEGLMRVRNLGKHSLKEVIDTIESKFGIRLCDSSFRYLKDERNSFMKEKHICCICGEEFEGYGNNPYPLVLKEGERCCDKCNDYVIKARLYNIRPGDKTDIIALVKYIHDENCPIYKFIEAQEEDDDYDDYEEYYDIKSWEDDFEEDEERGEE